MLCAWVTCAAVAAPAGPALRVCLRTLAALALFSLLWCCCLSAPLPFSGRGFYSKAFAAHSKEATEVSSPASRTWTPPSRQHANQDGRCRNSSAHKSGSGHAYGRRSAGTLSAAALAGLSLHVVRPISWFGLATALRPNNRPSRCFMRPACLGGCAVAAMGQPRWWANSRPKVAGPAAPPCRLDSTLFSLCHCSACRRQKRGGLGGPRSASHNWPADVFAAQQAALQQVQAPPVCPSSERRRARLGRGLSALSCLPQVV